MENDKILRTILLGLLIFLAGLIASFFAGYWIGGKMERENIRQHTDTTYVTEYDTIPYFYPVPKDSNVVRYITRKLPVADSSSTQTIVHDTVSVDIPITQKMYEADSYRAYVSGYEPNLDSIFVREKTIHETVTIPVKQKQNRFGFGVGVGAGYGIINKKPDIFVGGTLYMRIF